MSTILNIYFIYYKPLFLIILTQNLCIKAAYRCPRLQDISTYFSLLDIIVHTYHLYRPLLYSLLNRYFLFLEDYLLILS